MKKRFISSIIKKMLEGAKLIGAGAATIALAGAAIGIGNVFSSLIHSVARNSIFSETIIRVCDLRIRFDRSDCAFCLNDGFFDSICFLVNRV